MHMAPNFLPSNVGVHVPAGSPEWLGLVSSGEFSHLCLTSKAVCSESWVQNGYGLGWHRLPQPKCLSVSRY